ncbi:MAG: Gfo/Idh/MocA family protein [Thermoproteota archaeon]
MEAIKVGFIGCGAHSTASLYPCFRGIPEMQLVATCDLVEEKARRNAQAFGAKKWYTDYERMIEEEELDAVFIVGSPKMHTELGIGCLERGLHIFVEKPPSLNLADALRFFEASKRAGRHVFVAFMKRHAPGYILAKKIIEEPEFGRIMGYEAKFSNGPYPKIWGLDSAPLSFLIGQVIHHFDLMRFLVGEVAEIRARLSQLDETQFVFSVILSFRNGATGVMNINSCERWGTEMDGGGTIPERVQVTGEGSYVIVDNVNKVISCPRNLLEPSIKSTHIFSGASNLSLYGYYYEMRHFAISLLKGSAPKADIEDGVKALMLAEAVSRSVKEDRAISIQ